MKLWGSLDWIFICHCTKFQLKIPSFAPRKALMSTQKKYVYSCQMGFGSECSLGGTQLPAPPGQLGGTPVLGQSGHRACTLPPTDVPPPNQSTLPLGNPAGHHAGRGRMRPARPGASCTSCACWPTPCHPSLGIMLPIGCSAMLGMGGRRVSAACGRPGTARHGYVLNLAIPFQVKGDVLGRLPWARHTHHGLE